MPLCQGRAIGPGHVEPCPDNRRGESVRNRQGDLDLCDACAEFRFPRDDDVSAATSRRRTGSKSKLSSTKLNELKQTQTEQCMSCLNNIAGNALRVKCSICTGIVHFSCTGIAEKSRRTFFEIFDRTGWMCNDCRMSAHTKFAKLQADVGALRELVTELRQEVKELKAASSHCQLASKGSVGNLSSPPPDIRDARSSTDDNVQSIVHKELYDADRRKRNVIVCGMPENESISDTESFQDICEQHLNCKPYIVRSLRLGQPKPNAVRRLLIRLRSDECAAELLRSAHLLRHAEHPGTSSVYINPDLTPAAAKLAFEERQRRRAKTALSKNRVNCPSDENESLVQPDAVGTSPADRDAHIPTTSNADADAAKVTLSSFDTNRDIPVNSDQDDNIDLLPADCDNTSSTSSCGQKVACGISGSSTGLNPGAPPFSATSHAQ